MTVTEFASLNWITVSVGIWIGFAGVRTTTPVPAAAPAPAPMAAPLPPPAMAPMMAPRAAPPPILAALLLVGELPARAHGRADPQAGGDAADDGQPIAGGAAYTGPGTHAARRKLGLQGGCGGGQQHLQAF